MTAEDFFDHVVIHRSNLEEHPGDCIDCGQWWHDLNDDGQCPECAGKFRPLTQLDEDDEDAPGHTYEDLAAASWERHVRGAA